MSTPTNIGRLAYIDIRDYIIATWNFIELLDDNDDSILKLNVSDNRVTWIIDPENELIISLQLILTGTDSEIEDMLPLTIHKSRILKGTTIMDEKELPYNDFVLPLSTSQIALSHRLELPYSSPEDSEETI